MYESSASITLVSRSGMSEGKICVPETFSDGEFSQWMRRFDLCSAANKWDDEIKLVRLPTLLRGRAFSMFERLQLSEEDRSRMQP